MGGLLTRRRDRGGCDGGGDDGNVDVAVVVDLYQTCWAGFHVTVTWRGSLGALSVPADWQVRVFGSSGIIGRPSDRLYVRTIRP